MGLLFHECPIVRCVHFDLQTLGLYLYCNAGWRSVHTVWFALSVTAVLYAFLWNCSHDAMGLDAICNILTLELHIAIAQNRYGTHSCVTSHTSMHCAQSKSHHVNSVINNHSIQFLYLKNRSRTSHRVNKPWEADAPTKPTQIYTPLL